MPYWPLGISLIASFAKGSKKWNPLTSKKKRGYHNGQPLLNFEYRAPFFKDEINTDTDYRLQQAISRRTIYADPQQVYR
jgi:hypothetical protein